MVDHIKADDGPEFEALVSTSPSLILDSVFPRISLTLDLPEFLSPWSMILPIGRASPSRSS